MLSMADNRQPIEKSEQPAASGKGSELRSFLFERDDVEQTQSMITLGLVASLA
jgi:hypothetical protein